MGAGSELHARSAPDGTVAVGGRVALVGERPLSPAPATTPHGTA